MIHKVNSWSKKTKENLFAIHLMTSYPETLSVKTLSGDDDEDFDYKDILHFFL